MTTAELVKEKKATITRIIKTCNFTEKQSIKYTRILNKVTDEAGRFIQSQQNGGIMLTFLICIAVVTIGWLIN